MKKSLKLLGIIVFATIFLNADFKSPFEIGRYFKGEKETNGTINKKPDQQKSTNELLIEMLNVQREQLQVQKNILATLQEEYNPKPKVVTINGKRCIANSNADCFVMPMLGKDAKAVPVLGQFVTNPTVETAKEWLRWQAKYFKTAFKGGESIQLALNKYGSEAYPLNYNRYEMNTMGGYSDVLKSRNNMMILSSLAGRLEFYFFFGKNGDADTMAFDTYAKFAKKIPNLKYHLVFYSNNTKEYFNEMSKAIKDINELKIGASSISVSPTTFTSFNVYTTPTIGMYIHDIKKMETILVGNVGVDDTIEKAISALEYDDVLKDGHSPGYKQWERAGSYSSTWYKNYYNLNLDIGYRLKQYKGI